MACMEVLAGYVLLGAVLGLWSPWQEDHGSEPERHLVVNYSHTPGQMTCSLSSKYFSQPRAPHQHSM